MSRRARQASQLAFDFESSDERLDQASCANVNELALLDLEHAQPEEVVRPNAECLNEHAVLTPLVAGDALALRSSGTLSSKAASSDPDDQIWLSRNFDPTAEIELERGSLATQCDRDSLASALVEESDPVEIDDLRTALAAFEQRCVLNRWKLATSANGEVCLDQLAKDALIERSQLDFPDAALLVKTLVARIGLEELSDRENGYLILLRALWSDLKAQGKGLPPSNRYVGRPSKAKLAELMGEPLAHRYFSRPIMRLIDEIFADIGLEKAPDKEISKELGVILAYCNQLRSKGDKVPAKQSTPNQPYYYRIALICGLPGRTFDRKARYRDVLKALGAELGYVVVDRIQKKPSRDFPLCKKIIAWAKNLEDENLQVPARIESPNEPYFKQIAIDAGVTERRAISKTYRKFIKSVAVRLGLKIKTAPPYITLGQLQAEADAFRRAESSEAQTKNLRSFLKRLIRDHAEGKDADAKHVLEVVAETSSDAGARFQARVAVRCLNSMAHGLPASYARALKVACDRAGFSMTGASIAAGLPPLAAMSWKRCPPSRARIPLVHRLEVVLRLPQGALVSRLKIASQKLPQIDIDRFPENVRLDRRLRRLLVLRLKFEDIELPDEAFRLRCNQILEEMAASTTKREVYFRTRKSRTDLPKLPELVAQQFGAICESVTTVESRRRALVLERGINPGKIRWNSVTAQGNEKKLRGYFRFLANADVDRAPVSAQQMTLALIVFPSIAMRYMATMAKGRPDGEARDGHADVVRLFRTLLKEGGILAQMPGLAETLQPIPDLVHAADIARVRADWKLACLDAHHSYQQFLDGTYYGDVDNMSLGALMPILEMEDPSSVIFFIIDAIRAKEPARGNKEWAIWVRDLLYFNIQLRFALRMNTAINLRVDHFKLIGGSRHLDVPRKLFKNRDSSVYDRGAIKINFTRPLMDHGGFLELLDTYVSEARPMLIKDVADDGILFVGRDGKPLKTLHNIIRGWSEWALLEAPSQLNFPASVKSLNNHAFRHIMATTIIRREGSAGWESASWFLMDTVEIVRKHYAFLLERDLNKGYERSMAGILNRN